MTKDKKESNENIPLILVPGLFANYKHKIVHPDK